jgi:DNA replication protein DnaD
MTQAELTDELAERAAQLLDEAEADLGRPLTPAEEDSLLDEFLAGLDEDEGEETPP